jgi:hypothetical protein
MTSFEDLKFKLTAGSFSALAPKRSRGREKGVDSMGGDWRVGEIR